MTQPDKPRRLARLAPGIVVFLALTLLVGAPAIASAAAAGPATAGGIGLRLVDAPVSARDDPRARIYIVDHLAPGTTINRRIEVSNTTASVVHVVLYPAAATIAGGSFIGSAGRSPNDLSTWTSVLPDTADVPAGGRVMATVTIGVPKDAAPGEQYGVVWAEASAVPLGGGGVFEVSRVGIRLYLSVGPGGPPAANFTITSLTAKRTSDGRPMVLAAVHNTGGRALDMSGALQLSAGPGGLSAGPFAVSLGTTLAIGDTEPVTIALDSRLPAGPWGARITLHSGLVERTSQATITFPAVGASDPVKTTAVRVGRLPAVLAGLLAGLLVVATGGALVVWAARRRSRRVPRAAVS
jgi:hypothetical protein